MRYNPKRRKRTKKMEVEEEGKREGTGRKLERTAVSDVAKS